MATGRVGGEGETGDVGDPVEQRPTERDGQVAAAQADRLQLLEVFAPRVRCYLSGPTSLSPIGKSSRIEEARPTAQGSGWADIANNLGQTQCQLRLFADGIPKP